MSKVTLDQNTLDQFRAVVVDYCFEQFSNLSESNVNHEEHVHPPPSGSATVVAQFLVAFLEQKTLSDFVDPELFFTHFQDTLSEEKLQTTVSNWLSQAWQLVLESLEQVDVPITSAMSQSAFVEAFVAIAGEPELKRRWVQALVHNKQYQEMISRVMVQVLAQFFEDERIFSKLPGVSQLMKMGRWGVGKMLSQWGQVLEGLLQSFIQSNVAMVLRLSENFLLERFTEDNLYALAQQLWQTMAQYPVSSFGEAAKAIEGDRLSTWSQMHLKVFFKSPVWHALLLPVLHRLWINLCTTPLGTACDVCHISKSLRVAICERFLCTALKACGGNSEVKAWVNDLLAPCFTEAFLNSVVQPKS